VGNLFQVSSSSGSLAVNAGQSGSVQLIITPAAGFTATAMLDCAGGLPAGATCSFTPSPVSLNGSPTSTTLILATVAPSASAGQVVAVPDGLWWSLRGAAVILGLLLLGWPGRKKRLKPIASVATLALLICIIGCGGAGYNPSSPSPNPPATTTTALTSSGTKAAEGNTVTLTAAVTSSKANVTGNIRFFEGSTQLGPPVTVSNGRAQLQVNSLLVGTHGITAQYGGDSANFNSTSSTLQQVVTGATQLHIMVSAGGESQNVALNVTIQ
jgi:hypothetical protein